MSAFALDPRAGNSILLVVGNTYQRLSNSEAEYDQTGKYKKYHDWVLFVDVIQGDSSLIANVQFNLHATFKPQTFVCTSPVNIILPDGSRVSRFKTRQQSYASFTANIRITGRGGSTFNLVHTLSFEGGGQQQVPVRFTENRPIQDLRMNKMPEDNYGVELELSTSWGVSREQVAQTIQSKAGIDVTIIENYSEAHVPVDCWKIVHDGSITCSPDFPNCTKFELVSPILRGGSGLNQVSNILRAMKDVASDVNKSMGFHVHINVAGMSLQSLIKLCQNFVKYEDAMDTLMPPSRRTGSRESNRFFKSNKLAVGTHLTNEDRHRAIASCNTIEELCNLMNPTGRYYKLNLQNIISNQQRNVAVNNRFVRNYKPTVEFRQHSATTNYAKVSSWVRFCMAMVKNSEKLAAPKSLKSSRGADEQFEFLFEYVIKDRALRSVFVNRREQVANDHSMRVHGDGCCDSCASGRGCSRHHVGFIPR
mmetsp:Transcript_12395/g.18528  ORF Transcript_12395/g.18528 Transcript_12395/m.18528 type:complete len:478 (-) Transcript_12395:89-1522(-)